MSQFLQYMKLFVADCVRFVQSAITPAELSGYIKSRYENHLDPIYLDFPKYLEIFTNNVYYIE